MARPLDQSFICPTLIGRDAQLALLSNAFEVVATGNGRTLLLAGEAGIGKSRLVSAAKAIARAQNWLILEGHCFEPDRFLPYAPLLDLFHTLLDGAGTDELADILGPEARDLVKVLPELSRRLPGIEPVPLLDAAHERRLAIQAFATVLLRLAARRPALAIFEDLHWCDDTSLDAILHLARRGAQVPLLLVLTYRDDEVTPELSHALATLARERLTLELVLPRLNASEVGAMLHAIYADASLQRADARDALHALTDGNPFFVEELVSTLVPSEATGPVAWDRLQLDEQKELRIPHTIQDAVQRRVERLSTESRRVLELAAVAGRRCDFALLQVLTGHAELALLDLIKELIAAQLLVEEAADRFAFRHALTREAVYAQLLSRERRRQHQNVAEAMEALHIDSQDLPIAELAYHFYAAGAWQRALDYSVQAGAHAMALYAPRAAVEQLTRALDAAQRLSRSPAPDLFRARGRAYDMLGDFARARADYEAALRAARATRAQRAEWQALLDLGLLWSGHDYEQTAEYSRRALALARTLGDPLIVAHSLNRIGNWHTNVGRPRDALALHQEALTIVEASGDRLGMAETLDLLGVAYYVAGIPCESMRYYMSAVEQCQALGDRQHLAWCLSVLALSGSNHQTEGGATPALGLDECAQHARRAIALAHEINWRPGEAFAQHVCGSVHLARADYAQAFELLESAVTLATEIGHLQWMTASCCTLGVLYLDLLHAQPARHYLERALADAHAMGSTLWVQATSPMLAAACLLDRDLDAAQSVIDAVGLTSLPEVSQGARDCWIALAHLHLARGQAQEALHLADQLIATDPYIAGERTVPRLAWLRGEALLALGRVGEAEASLRAADEGARAQERPSLVWRTQLLLSQLLRVQGRVGEADATLASARDIVTTLAASVPDETIRETFLANATALLSAGHQPPAGPVATPRQHYPAGLSAREVEVLRLVAEGLTDAEVAAQLYLSRRTVSQHLRSVYNKLGVNTRTAAARFAVDNGLT